MTAAGVIAAWILGWIVVGLLAQVIACCIRPQAWAKWSPATSILFALFGPLSLVLIPMALERRDEEKDKKQ